MAQHVPVLLLLLRVAVAERAVTLTEIFQNGDWRSWELQIDYIASSFRYDCAYAL